MEDGAVFPSKEPSVVVLSPDSCQKKSRILARHYTSEKSVPKVFTFMVISQNWVNKCTAEGRPCVCGRVINLSKLA